METSLNSERPFLCIRCILEDTEEASCFCCDLLREKVELTLTDAPHCSHHPSDSEISERKCPRDRKQSKETVEETENREERLQERGSCFG